MRYIMLILLVILYPYDYIGFFINHKDFQPCVSLKRPLTRPVLITTDLRCELPWFLFADCALWQPPML